ncbi:sodium channel protein Nach [Ooceraea biroi]|uniref:sodium channel protein Nach n=1 Tax=Ooceraea biroi TaxID=2015173 RepID=UPI000F08D389|nr:sodium channel protein Nach [Ooceraea biroi]
MSLHGTEILQKRTKRFRMIKASLRMITNLRSTLVEVYEEFSVKSTISGLKYTTLAQTKFGRCFWAIILLSFLGFAISLAMCSYKRYQSTSINMVIINTQYPMSMIDLPAVTLCHGGIVMMHKLISFLTSNPKRIFMPRGLTRADFENSSRYLREAIYPKNYFPDELDKLHQILSANRLTLLELFENVSANCSDFLLMCQLEGKTVPCSTLFEPVVTPNGICCAFNYENSQVSQRSNELLKRSNSARIGPHFILSLLMKSYSSEDRVASIMHGDGVKVFVHERNVYSLLEVVEFMAPAGHESVAQLTGTKLTSASNCMTGCADPGAENRYQNCYMRCWKSAVWELCGCQIMSGVPMEHGRQACDLPHIPCLARAAPRANSILKQEWQCDCLADCKSTVYGIAVATAPLNAAQYSPSPFHKEVLRHQNVTALHFTFAKQSTRLLQRRMMISSTYILSYVGGIFALFLGCSIISLIEILYYFCVFSVSKFKDKNRQRDAVTIH